MGAGQRYLRLTILGLLVAIAIFNYIDKSSSIRHDDYRQPAMQKYSSVVRRLDDHVTNESDENSSLVRKLDHQQTTNDLVMDSSEPPGHEPSCFRQVQLFRGSNQPKQPKEYECPGLDCGIRFVEDTSYVTMEKSDAVVLFHLSHWNWGEMQRRRPLNQAWVFYSLESPSLTGGNAIPPKDSKHYYNYTMSYRPSSSIYSPYGVYDSKRPQVPADDRRNWAEGKTKLVAWMASNCHRHQTAWRRLDFVQKLSQHIKVDTYGGCGTIKCPRGSAECFKILQSYKFYLALENHECSEYITEKLWHNALMQDVVPIVYGARKEDYLKVAPPNSFIFLEDFKSFPELTDYLNLLDSNDTLYNSFFEWKRHGSVSFTGEGVALKAPFLCQVVSKVRIHENNMLNGKQEEVDTTTNIHEWWSQSCRKVSGFPHDF